MIEKAKCPYCGHENDMTEALSGLSQDDKFDWECGNCGKSFQAKADIDVYFVVAEILIEY